MSDVAAQPAAAPAPLVDSTWWPPGTTAFTVRTFLALALSLYCAFFFELSGASSAAVCVIILAQPNQGMVLAKSIYRLLGTLVGCGVALLITALFPQDRTMLIAAFTLFMALETALGSLLRDFRSYGSILAGYTVAIISVTNIDTPDATFDAAINRVAAIVLGIMAIAIVNIALAGSESSRILSSKLRAVTADILALMRGALDARAPTTAQSYALASRLAVLRGEISHATPETPGGSARARGARSALLSLYQMLGATNAMAVGMQHLQAPSAVIDRTRGLVGRALRLQHPQTCLSALDALTREAVASDGLSLEEAFVLDRSRYVIEILSDLRDGLRALRTARRPRRDVKLPVHEDYVAVVLNAVRVVVAVSLVAILSVMSGITDTAQVVLFTAVFVSLGSVQTDPTVLGKTAILGIPVVIVIGTIYAFFIFPNIDGFPLFILSLAPIVLATCWLVQKGLAGAGLIVGSQTIVLIGPANVQTIDPDTFVQTATMLFLSGIAIYLSVQLVLPVDRAQRRLRLALATGDELRAALADRRHARGARSSRFYDRLAQFKTWQGAEAVTLARRKTAKRLIDLGQLAQAVERAWSALDQAKPYVDAEVDANTRALLPRLVPAATYAAARDYLDAAHRQGGDAVRALVHAAGALYGTSVLTTTEARLLRRVELLGRWP